VHRVAFCVPEKDITLDSDLAMPGAPEIAVGAKLLKRRANYGLNGLRGDYAEKIA
jgi:hypothetical protein